MEQKQWMNQIFYTRKSFAKQQITILTLILPQFQLFKIQAQFLMILSLTPLFLIIMGLILYKKEIISHMNLIIINDSIQVIFSIVFNLHGVQGFLEGDGEDVYILGQLINVFFCIILLTCQTRSVILVCILINMIGLARVIFHLINYHSNNPIRILIQYLYGGIIITGVVVQLLFLDIELEKAHLRQKAYKNHTMKVVHDLKNPVLAIQQIIKDTSDVEQIKKEVQEETMESIEMLEGLRLSFKVENHMEIKEEPQLTNLFEYVNSMKSSHVNMADTCNNKIFCQVNINENANYTHYMFPRTIVKRILNNFITNSLKHTQKGKIYLKATQINQINSKSVSNIIKNNEFIRIGNEISNEQNQIMFEVIDSGYGIPDEKINSIFDEMNSDQAGKNWDGCGLGLAICKSLAIKINAAICYKSKVNIGSTFRLQVPVINEQNLHPNTKENNINHDTISNSDNYILNNVQMKTYSEKDTNQINKSPIIIAEDSRILCRTQSKYLKRENIQFEMQMNGQDCLENIIKIVAKNKEQNKSQRIMVFTDNNMPLKNGMELAQELRLMSAQFYIVLISADEIHKNYQGLFDEIFLKPIQISKIKDCILKNIQQENNK